MKKLLIAMTAAAVGTCAWAEGEQTLLNETFESTWTLTDNTWWTYSAGEAADGELTLADGKLSLNTGSKVLTGSFTSDDEPKAIGTDGLYFKSTVTFKDPSDTLPELKDSDKFALVVLDNVESIDAGYTTTPATNLWVIAKYGESGQRAYQLDVEVDPTWLAAEHEIVVKAYNNVMANGNCAGFLVKVDNKDNDTVCTVVQSCAIVNGVIDYGTSCAYNWWKDGDSGNLGYLGYPQDAILGAIQKRYTDATLILSNVPSSGTLASVDFQGQGVIDNVSLATSGAGFGTDSLALTVVPDGVTLVDTATTLFFAKVGDKVTIKFRVNDGFELSSPTGLTAVDGVYTYEYTTTANNEEVTISAFLPVAQVGDTKYPTVQAALTDIAENGGEIQLLGVAGQTITIADADAGVYGLDIQNNVTIDLNGMKLQGGGTYDNPVATITVSAGSLTVVDSKTGGAILAPNFSAEDAGQDPVAIDAQAGLTTIEAGTIGKITNGTASTLKLVGGSYTDVGETFYLTTEQMKYGDKQYIATLADGVWTVAEKQIVNYTVTFNVDGNTTAIAAQTVAENGTATAPAAPIKNGYAFAGWKLNDAAYDFATVVTGDITLVATWTAIEYAITYAWSGLEAGATPVNSNPATYTIEDGITFAAATCDGYTFKGFSPATITVGSTGGITVTGTFEKNAPAVTPVEPGVDTEYDSEDAANAAAAKTEVAVPDEVAAIEGFNQQAYKDLFAVTTKKVGNKWVVSVELTATATATLQQAVETAVKALPVAEVAALTTGGAAEVNVTATPGLYYSVESGASLGDMVEGNRTLATGSTVNLELKKQGNSGFYRIKVSVKGK